MVDDKVVLTWSITHFDLFSTYSIHCQLLTEVKVVFHKGFLFTLCPCIWHVLVSVYFQNQFTTDLMCNYYPSTYICLHLREQREREKGSVMEREVAGV